MKDDMNQKEEQERIKLYEEYSMMDLFEEVLSLHDGDLWDGFMSKGHKERYNLARKIFEDRLKQLTLTP